jgi:hypothetical protein
MMYAEAADRYDNIYRSIWTIFSYMSAVTAAFLAFGGQRITAEAIAAIAPLPLMFWFWSTYFPLDRYGNNTLNELKTLENDMAKEYGQGLRYFSRFAREDHGLIPHFWALWNEKGVWRAGWDTVRRARFAIIASFLVLHGVWGCGFAGLSRTGFQFLKPEPAPTVNVLRLERSFPLELVGSPTLEVKVASPLHVALMHTTPPSQAQPVPTGTTESTTVTEK